MSKKKDQMPQWILDKRDHYKSILRLNDWRIDLVLEPMEQTEDEQNNIVRQQNGYCTADPEYFIAVIGISDQLTESDDTNHSMTVLHEMIHVVLAELQYAVINKIIHPYCKERYEVIANRELTYNIERLNVRLSTIIRDLENK